MSATTHIIATVKAECRFGPEGMSLVRLGGLSPGKMPAWFRRIVQRDFGGCFNAEWFEHHARAGDSLAVEPYQLSDDSVRDLLAFTDRYSLSVSFSGMSGHYPTRTFSVFLKPRAEKAT
jgi:hypothetical protein